MRISTLQVFDTAITGLQRNYNQVTRTQEQVSSGVKLLSPADDPVGAARLLQLDQEQALLTQYQGNLGSAKNSLSQEESLLASAESVLQRVRELAGLASSPTLTAESRKAITSELAQREQELLDILNSRNARGEYLFAGSQGDTVPFVQQPDGSYAYQGDEGQRRLQISSNSYLPVTDSGKLAFEQILNTNRANTAAGAGNAGTAVISRAQVENKQTYDTTVPFSTGGAVTITFLDDRNYEIRNAPAPAPALSSGALDGDPSTDDIIRFGGVRVEINGTPAAGDTFTITPDTTREKTGALNIVRELRVALEGADDSQQGRWEVRDAVAIALTNVDAAIAQVLDVRAQVGARLNTVESTELQNADFQLVNKQVISDIRDLDYAEALSRLASQTLILEAAQSTFAKVSQLTLFNQL